MGYIYLIIAFLLNSTANVMLKINAANGVVVPSRNLFEIFAANKYLVIALSIFALNIIFYFLSLKNLPLSVAYPVMTAMTFIIVNTICVYLLKEPLSIMQIFGYFLVLLGISFVILFAQKTT